MTPATVALLSQLLPLVLAAVGGWAARHFNLIGPKAPNTPATPAAPATPAIPTTPVANAHPLLSAARDAADKILEEAVADALKRMTPPPAPPKIAG